MNHPIQVVVAYDFSPSSGEALGRAVDLAAREPHHVLHIIAVLDPHDRVMIEDQPEDPTYEAADKFRAHLTEHVTAAFAGRATAADVQFFVHARIGKTATVILALAAEVGADLIFVGSHGKTGLERIVLGSVSERIVREAGCPVMVARPKTYADVHLMKVTKFEHTRAPHREPHIYSAETRQVNLRPDAWPNG